MAKMPQVQASVFKVRPLKPWNTGRKKRLKQSRSKGSQNDLSSRPFFHKNKAWYIVVKLSCTRLAASPGIVRLAHWSNYPSNLCALLLGSDPPLPLSQRANEEAPMGWWPNYGAQGSSWPPNEGGLYLLTAPLKSGDRWVGGQGAHMGWPDEPTSSWAMCYRLPS